MKASKTKKILSLILTMVLIFSTATAVYAENGNSKLIVQKKLESLQGKYDVTFVDSSEIKSDLPRLKFATVEEFEEFLNAIENAKDGDSAQVILNEVVKQGYDVSDAQAMAPDAVIYEGVDRIRWWAPFTGWGWTGLACWKNIAFSYEYEFINYVAKFVSVSDVESYLDGLTVAITWNQTNVARNFNTARDTVSFTILGYYLLGVDVGGFEIGARINDTWRNSYVLNE